MDLISCEKCSMWMFVLENYGSLRLLRSWLFLFIIFSVGFIFQNEVVAFDAAGNELSVRSTSPSHQRRIEDRRNNHFFDHPGQPYVPRQFKIENIDSGLREHSPTYDRGRGRVNIRDMSPPYARITDGGRFREYSTVDGRGRGRGVFRRAPFGRGGGRGFRDYSPPTLECKRGGQRDFSPSYGKGRGRGRMHDVSPSYENRSARRYRDISPVYEPVRSNGRFREISPTYSPRRDARIFDRNFTTESESLHFRDDDGSNRNNPNISPRVGDWICRNTTCGNLNFARREYCNNCNKFRYEPGEGRHSSSPRRQYSDVSCSMDPLPVSRPVDRHIVRDVGRYKSPPRRWTRDGPRGPAPKHGGRFPDVPVRREIVDDREGIEFRGRDKFDRILRHEWDNHKRGRVELLQERRGYDREDDSWVRKERSRSPVRMHLPKDSHYISNTGRGRGDRHGVARGRGRTLF